MGEYINELSPLERKLLETQDIVTVRGKKGRPVPILIPQDMIVLMQLLLDDEVRGKIGVDTSPYVFATLKNPGKADDTKIPIHVILLSISVPF